MLSADYSLTFSIKCTYYRRKSAYFIVEVRLPRQAKALLAMALAVSFYLGITSNSGYYKAHRSKDCIK